MTDSHTLPDAPLSDIYTHGMGDMHYLILMDRYAQKDPHGPANVKKQDLVVAIVDNDKKDTQQKRELGRVLSVSDLDDGTRTVEVRLHPTGDMKTLNADLIDLPLETSPQEIRSRIARGMAAVEKEPGVRKFWAEQFEWLMEDWKFVPGGRIMTAAGTDQDLSYFNCFVIPSPKDSRSGIMQSLANMAEIMSHGGGVGINVSTLRPKNAYVKGVNGRSSGAVSWGALFSYVTGLIEQAGSRRGALMVILNDWHPDVFRFIRAKEQAGIMTNCNVSVGVSNALMAAVKADADWVLRFPDTAHPTYNEEWDGDITAWEAKGYPVKVFDTVKARDVWNAIVKSAWTSAEPGLWFNEYSNQMSNSYYYPEGKLIATNPCGEQPISGWSVCNLGAINLAQFWDKETQDVDWISLARAARVGSRFLDNAIDATPYHFEANRVQQQDNERRVGLGIMGLADLMIYAGIRYGSVEGAAFADKVAHHLAVNAYNASADWALEKGSFGKFDAEKFLNSGYMLKMDEDVREKIRRQGIRNVTLLTVAPTGTTGTMVAKSTGIEPYFSWKWYRKGRLGYFEENAQIVQDYAEANGIEPDADGNYDYALPDYFVNAMELEPIGHVRMMAAWQRWNDSAISKTVNCPKDYTIEQVDDLYQLMFEMGCKGGTIYRDGCRDEQVLTLKKDESQTKDVESTHASPEAVKVVQEAADWFKKGWQSYEDRMVSAEIPETFRNPHMSGLTLKGATPYGNVFITINEDPTGVPFEVFINTGKSGTDLQAQGESLGRMFSLAVQSHPPVKRMAMLRVLVEQLRGIGGAMQHGLGPKRVMSFPDAVAKIIEEQYLSLPVTDDGTRQASSIIDQANRAIDNINVIYEDNLLTRSQVIDLLHLPAEDRQQEIHKIVSVKGADTCPECGNISLVNEVGCKHCVVCEYTAC